VYLAVEMVLNLVVRMVVHLDELLVDMMAAYLEQTTVVRRVGNLDLMRAEMKVEVLVVLMAAK
jgi:hypothetical protein